MKRSKGLNRITEALNVKKKFVIKKNWKDKKSISYRRPRKLKCLINSVTKKYKRDLLIIKIVTNKF